jgi:multiple sugar transport system permease protein
VIFLAGMTAVPQDVLDAATIDCAGFWRRNYQVILPMIMPIVVVGLIFGTVFTFTDLRLSNQTFAVANVARLGLSALP